MYNIILIMQYKKVKIGRNNKCSCGSEKKYKYCCINNKTMETTPLSKYKTGHSISSEFVQKSVDALKNIYPNHNIIDVTNYLNPRSYRSMQMMNIKSNIIMVAERNDVSEQVFIDRIPRQYKFMEYNMIVMYRGAYRCFNIFRINEAMSEIKKMVQ